MQVWFNGEPGVQNRPPQANDKFRIGRWKTVPYNEGVNWLARHRRLVFAAVCAFWTATSAAQLVRDESKILFSRYLEFYPEDYLAKMYLEHSLEYEQEPPDDAWNAVEVFYKK